MTMTTTNEPFIPLPIRQNLMKNKLDMERMKAMQVSHELAKEVGVSELR